VEGVKIVSDTKVIANVGQSVDRNPGRLRRARNRVIMFGLLVAAMLGLGGGVAFADATYAPDPDASSAAAQGFGTTKSTISGAVLPLLIGLVVMLIVVAVVLRHLKKGAHTG
jgi:hypothetical protein